MRDKEIVMAVNYANAIDPRVQSNQPTYEVWYRVLAKFDFTQAQAAIQLFYERYSDASNRPVVDAASIRRIISQETTRAVAKSHALEAGPKKIGTIGSWRQRNPAEWDRLFALGAEQRQDELDARGVA